MYTNFWTSMGSLSWLDNYHEALLVVYDIVIMEERDFSTKEGFVFDEDAYFQDEFSNEEKDILSTELVASERARKYKAAKMGKLR